MAAAGFDEERIKPTSTTVDGAQSRQRNSANGGMRNRAQSDLRLGKQAKAVMDEFIKALAKVGEVAGEIGLEREQTTREATKSRPDKNFRDRMLRNAPKKDGDHIIAEKKSW